MGLLINKNNLSGRNEKTWFHCSSLQFQWHQRRKSSTPIPCAEFGPIQRWNCEPKRKKATRFHPTVKGARGFFLSLLLLLRFCVASAQLKAMKELRTSEEAPILWFGWFSFPIFISAFTIQTEPSISPISWAPLFPLSILPSSSSLATSQVPPIFHHCHYSPFKFQFLSWSCFWGVK